MNIYTDGSCLFKEGGGPGGWAFVVVDDSEMDVVHTDSGNATGTTNNRMEIVAVMQALKYCIDNNLKEVVIKSDSQYVVNSYNKWMYSWVKKMWKGIANPDLWKEMYQLSKQTDVLLIWVRGHDGNKYNEMADELANEKRLEVMTNIEKRLSSRERSMLYYIASRMVPNSYGKGRYKEPQIKLPELDAEMKMDREENLKKVRAYIKKIKDQGYDLTKEEHLKSYIAWKLEN